MSEVKPAQTPGTTTGGPPASGEEDTICFAQLSQSMAVVRVVGRGSFQNSVELKRLGDNLAERYGHKDYQFILDLDACTTMDSTFMGVLASVGLRHKKDTGKRLVIVNANEQTTRLMKTLGIDKFLDVRAQADAAAQTSVGEECFQAAGQAEISKAERIIHMIEAHQTLCDVDSENVVRFESVLKFLHESLDREKR